jgi:hypothetical protein
MNPITFITIEEGTDLIVSFVAEVEEDVKNVMILRTPKYEFMLPEEERGPTAGSTDFPGEEFDMVKSIEWQGDEVRIVSLRHRYVLDVRRVEPEEIREAKRVLKEMDFDGRFELRIDGAGPAIGCKAPTAAPGEPETNPALGRAILEAVDNQLKADDPPETRQALHRLMTEGLSQGDAKTWIARAVCVEIWDIMKNNVTFNRERYLRNLKNLPKTPTV